jgi:Protein of unknown function (DUF2726)
MRLKRLVNHTEQKILEELRETGRENNFQVEVNQRIADIVDIDGSGISNEEFSFALKSHFDFVVVQDYIAQFVVEFDGPHHEEEKQKVKDAIKDKLCMLADLPILRLDTSIIRNSAREYSIAQWFAEVWFLSREFDRMQQAGQIDSSEPFMYHGILGHAGGPWNFPYDIARPVLVFMQKLYKEGVSKGFSSRSILYGREGRIYCKSYFRVSEEHVVSSRVEFKSFSFPPISPFELAEDLAIKNLEQNIIEYYNTSKGGIKIDLARKEIERMEVYCKANNLSCRINGVEL